MSRMPSVPAERRKTQALMQSHGSRQPRRFDDLAVPAALGALAVFALTAALVRLAVAVLHAAERDEAREAELSEWAYSGLS